MTASAITVPHPNTGEPLPPFLTADAAAKLLGKDAEFIAAACERGDLPALSHERGQPWVIPTGRLLETIGLRPGDQS